MLPLGTVATPDKLSVIISVIYLVIFETIYVFDFRQKQASSFLGLLSPKMTKCDKQILAPATN